MAVAVSPATVSPKGEFVDWAVEAERYGIK